MDKNGGLGFINESGSILCPLIWKEKDLTFFHRKKVNSFINITVELKDFFKRPVNYIAKILKEETKTFYDSILSPLLAH